MRVNAILGRWQVPELHQGHKDLIQFVSKDCDQLVLLVGVCPATPTKYNPLDFTVREAMLRESFPKAIILPITDHPEDIVWSERIDSLLYGVFPSASRIRLCGGRDNSLSHYKGRLEVWDLANHDFFNSCSNYSGTEERKRISSSPILNSKEFRAGVIYATERSYDKVYPVVDIAVVETNVSGEIHLLLGKKPGSNKWVFPGGFVDPVDGSYEVAAIRELEEETGLIVSSINDLIYLGSFPIPDYRYRKLDTIMSSFFLVDYSRLIRSAEGVEFGEAFDDLSESRFFRIDRPQDRLHTQVCIAQHHEGLFLHLLNNLGKLKDKE